MYAGSRQLAMKQELYKLQTIAADIEAAAIISMDGLILTSTLPDNDQEDYLSAMSAALLSLAERVTMQFGRGYLEQVFIRGTDGDILMMAIGEQAVLTVMSRREAKLGMLIYYMRRSVKELLNFFS